MHYRKSSDRTENLSKHIRELSELTRIGENQLKRWLSNRDLKKFTTKELVQIIKCLKTRRHSEWVKVKRRTIEETLEIMLNQLEGKSVEPEIIRNLNKLKIDEKAKSQKTFWSKNEEKETEKAPEKEIEKKPVLSVKDDKQSANDNTEETAPKPVPIDVKEYKKQVLKDGTGYFSIIAILSRGNLESDKLCYLTFNLTNNIYESLIASSPKRRAIQLRIITNEDSMHCNWANLQPIISINQKRLNYDMNFLEIQKQALVWDISEKLADARNDKSGETKVVIKIMTRSIYSVKIVTEMIRPLRLNEIIRRVFDQNKIKDTFALKYRKFCYCEICSESDNLLRCSKCKSAWYCGELHQKIHWRIHRIFCSSQSFIGPHLLTGKNAKKDDIVLSFKSSLLCPFSQRRIKIPVRGFYCMHESYFDLESFLTHTLKQEIKTMKCPICKKILDLKALVVNQMLYQACTKADPSITKVLFDLKNKFWVEIKPRFNPDDVICID